MDSTTLAQNFNDVSDQLQARGHRVIVRRLRGFLEAGDARGAELFLVRAKEALGNNDAGVGGLATGLGAFTGAGGDVARLVTEPAWVEGAAKEKRLGRLVESAVTQQSLAGLVDQLSRQSRSLAAGEPLAAAPSRQLAPSALPPLPKAPTASGDAAAPLGSIFKPGRGRAVVEAEVELEPRALDLDEAHNETPDIPVAAPVIPEVEDLPEPMMAHEVNTPALEPISGSDTPLPSPEPGRRVASEIRGPMVLPELNAPPEMPTAPVGGSGGKSGNGAVVAGIVIALALIGAGLFFAMR
jgi:hypothetical protein